MASLRLQSRGLRHTSLEKDTMLGPTPGLRRQGGQRKEWTDDLIERSESQYQT